jgi:hypothetical protein
METPKEYHYTYYSYEEWGRGYFGVRTCECLPEEDIKYFGSFTDKNFRPTQKIILKDDYVTRVEANADEIILHDYYDVANNPHFANRAKATYIGFCASREQARENGKKNYKKGLALMDKETRKYVSGKGSETNKKNGTGIYAIPQEDRIKNGKKGGKNSQETSKKKKIGIYALTPEQRTENGRKGGKKAQKTNKVNGTGIYGITKEQRKEYSKKGGQTAKKLGLGIHNQTPEQRSENGKRGGAIGGKIGGKTTGSQKWMCLETGFITTPGALTNYQRKRGIDTSKRQRIS